MLSVEQFEPVGGVREAAADGTIGLGFVFRAPGPVYRIQFRQRLATAAMCFLIRAVLSMR